MWNLIALVVLLSGAIIAMTVSGSRKTIEEMSRLVIRQTLDQPQTQLERFFEPVVDELLLARSWGEAGLLDLDDPEALVRLLGPVLERHSAVSSLLIADDQKREYMLLHVDGKWRSRQTRPQQWPGRTRWLQWTAAEPTPALSWKQEDYDPHTRPWYQGAIERRRQTVGSTFAARPEQLVYWTDPYTFRTTRDAGITASVTFELAQRVYVIGFDVMLDDISQYTMALRAGSNGVVAVLEGRADDLKMIGLPRDERYEDREARREALLTSPHELDSPLFADAIAALDQRYMHGSEPIRFICEGRPWWGAGRTFSLSARSRLEMAVMLPESDLTPDMQRLLRNIIMIALLVLAVALLRVMVMARRYSDPIEALVRQSDRISRGDLDPPTPVVSALKEVQQLTAAHERMRQGLESLMKLERDMQLARQIQERTLPDRLPQLGGFELAAWGAPADATGGDTFDVIGHRPALDGEPVQLLTQRADQAVLLLADATGHGIGPALSATEIRAMLRMAVRNQVEMARIAHHLNEQLFDDLPEGRFITAWLGELHVADRTLTSFSAGQGSLLYYHAARHEVELRETDTLPFGVVADLEIVIGAPIVMQRGDIFAVISDGIFEACNEAGEALGVERVTALIKAHCSKSAQQLLVALQEAVAQHGAGVPAADDRTMIIIKCTGR
jgi:serine phosphatase RsbU (regulator of sigma subunit)